MKRINLKTITNALSSKEMKAVTGGGNTPRFSCEHDTSTQGHIVTGCEVLSFDLAITYCQFWAACGFDCSCQPCD